MAHTHREFTNKLSREKIGSLFRTTTLKRQAFKLLLRKANKHNNQKEESEAINQSTRLLNLFSLISEFERFWGHDGVGVRNWNKKQVDFEMDVNTECG